MFESVLQDISRLLDTDVAAVVVKFAIAAGLLGSCWNLLQQKRVLQTYVAMDFFKRYEAWKELSPDELAEVDTLSKLQPKERKEVLHSVVRYFNLCSEEFALYQARRVPHDIWKIWDYGIRQNFQQPLWREAWEEVSREYDSYRPFQKYIQKYVDVHPPAAQLKSPSPEASGKRLAA